VSPKSKDLVTKKQKNFGADMLEIHNGSLNVKEIQNRWYDEIRDKNLGALILFIESVCWQFIV
jgi:hypothetical protein